MNTAQQEKYQTYNGTYYYAETPKEVMHTLDRYIHSGERIRIFYGDVKTGRCWLEEHDVLGTISRSSGRIAIPLLIPNASSPGGTSILTHCIVRITVNKRDVYRHPNYHVGNLSLGATPKNTEAYQHGYPYFVARDGEPQAFFPTKEKAAKWLAFIKGERNMK